MTPDHVIRQIGPTRMGFQCRFGIQSRKESRSKGWTQVLPQELHGLGHKGTGLINPFLVLGLIGWKAMTQRKDGPRWMKIPILIIAILIIIITIIFVVVAMIGSLGIVLPFRPSGPLWNLQGFVPNDFPMVQEGLQLGDVVVFDVG